MIGLIAEKARAKADASNDVIILRLLDYLDKPYGTGCSYAQYIGKYVSYKLLMNYLNNRVDRRNLEKDREIANRIVESRRLMSLNHREMYSNPCHTCRACLTRRKPWPN